METETGDITPDRLPRHWTLACACALVLAGLAPAMKRQFLPGPGRSAPSQFPPAPSKSGAFPRAAPGRRYPTGRRAAVPPPGGIPAPAQRQRLPAVSADPPGRGAGATALRSARRAQSAARGGLGLFESFLVKEARLMRVSWPTTRTRLRHPRDRPSPAPKPDHVKIAKQIARNVCSGGGSGGGGSGGPAPGPNGCSDALRRPNHCRRHLGQAARHRHVRRLDR